MTLVVGGTGTLGRELVRRLVDTGNEVRVLTRDRARARDLPKVVDIALGDLRDKPSLAAAVRATPFMETWLNIIGGTLKESGHALVLGPGTNPVNFVSARDVAAAVVARVAAAPANESIDISGPHNVGLATLARQIIQASGQDARIKHVPLIALRVMALLGRLFSPAFARQAQAAVLLNTTDMSVPCEATAIARRPGMPATTFFDVLAGARA